MLLLLTYFTIYQPFISSAKHKLLKLRGDQERNRIKDIYTEISTIKHYLLDSNAKVGQLTDLKAYSKVFRFLLEKRNSELKFTLEQVFGSIEDSFKPISESKDFNELIKKFDISFHVDNNEVTIQNSNLGYLVDFGFKGVCAVDDSNYIDKILLEKLDNMRGILWAGEKLIKTNSKGESYLINSFSELKKYSN